MNSDSVQSVSQLTESIKFTLNDEFVDVLVSGEVSGLSRPQSGHIYMTLKDANAQLSTVIWRSNAAQLRFQPQEGMQVLCGGFIDVYAQRGTYQLIARTLQPLGQGELQLAFRKLHDKLKREGLFAEELKQPIPTYPKRVAVITSPTGAAIHDFLQVATRRWPFLDILVVPVQVQGPDAAGQIARALRTCSRKNFRFRPEVIVVTRGGGSIEDLWAFNEEVVVRAIHKCPVPVISAVGHEVDVSLSDLAADVRALTPSEAGEKLAPDAQEVIGALNSCSIRLCRQVERVWTQSHERLESVANRPVLRQPLELVRRLELQVDSAESKLHQIAKRRFELARQQLAHSSEILQLSLKNAIPAARLQLAKIAGSASFGRPLESIEKRRDLVGAMEGRLKIAIERKLELARRELELDESKLRAFNPESVLKRGYSLTVNEDGSPLVDCNDAKAGDTIRTWLANGSVASRVESSDPDATLIRDGQENEN